MIFNLICFLEEQKKWSEENFGPPTNNQAGVIDHIRKELKEIEENPNDLEEWIDVIILALDGAWRSGATPQEITEMLDFKFTKNKNRKWPDWKTSDPGKAIEHIKEKDETEFWNKVADMAKNVRK